MTLKTDLLNPRKPYWVAILFLLMIISSWLVSNHQKSSAGEGENSSESASLDTFVPAGFVLAPLDLVNISSIESILGDRAIVDIYTSGANKKLVAKNLKLVRAPLNPQQFAALIPEDNTELIQSLVEPVFAVIQNSTSKKSSEYFQKSHPTKSAAPSRLNYGDKL